MRARQTALFVVLAALALSAAAQIPGLGKPGDAAPAAVVDPLGRSTPRGTIVGFSQAVEREDFASAVQYLQLEGAQRNTAASLSRDLKELIDRELREAIGQISDDPGGKLDDKLPPDRELIGPLIISGESTYIELVKVRDRDHGAIWLISSGTLRKIPAIAGNAGRTWIERVMPAPLVESELLGLSLAHWLVLTGLLIAGFVLLALFGMVLDFAAKKIIRDPRRRTGWDAWYNSTRWPFVTILTILLQFFAIPRLGFPLTFRVAYAQVGLLAFVIALSWLLRRALKLGFSHARGLVRGRDRANTQSLMMLAERMVQALIVIVAIITVLILLGVENKTALAGLGVVGVALALGAQKTVENLLGGIFLLSDKALAVGDSCTIGNHSGTVEDVTLRSVRLRTQQQSLVSLPAGSLAQAGVENFATRRKIMILSTLRLRYGTSVEQLKRILAGIRALLEQNPQIEKDQAYVRLTNFGAEAIELELFAYVLSADAEVFRVVREELLLAIAALIETAGSALTPTRFIQWEESRAPAAR